MTRSGLLNLNKPPGMTSRRAVDLAGRASGCRRVGHTGTLDPLASGVLVVCVGQATRLTDHIHQLPKQYAATFLLGRQSPTEDVEGDVTLLTNPPIPSALEITRAASHLTGEILQRPPAFSALKVAGRRAYDLARRGDRVELEPRRIVVHRLEVAAYEYPELRLDIQCSSGTYVRSLGRDLAEFLGTAAVMSALVRTAVGDFCLSDAIAPDRLSSDNWIDYLLPPGRAVQHLPQIVLSDEQVGRIRAGQFIPTGPIPPGMEMAAFDTAGRLVALLEPRGPDRLKPVRVFQADP